MGGFSVNGQDFWDGLSEGLGFKTGLVLERGDLIALMKDDSRFADLTGLPADTTHGRRFESVEYEELFVFLLFKLGRLERDRRPLPIVDLHHRYKSNPKKYELVMSVGELFVEFGQALDFSKVSKAIDPSPFIQAAFDKHGVAGMEMALEIITGTNANMISSPWSRVRQIDWSDVVVLRDLFRSEKLVAPDGPFVDQRYIDFLHRNFNRVDDIHWRKFEGLTGDFFQREGYRVELGPGRGDGGVDLRVWKSDAGDGLPATILIQCKRQKAPVPSVIMKALYTDVEHEKAESGLIVTTSRLAPGAKDDLTARGYRIETAERATVQQWIAALRTPGAG